MKEIFIRWLVVAREVLTETDQTVDNDGISQRCPGQVSNKNGSFFIGGYELVQDRGTGTLTSAPFKVTHPFGSFLIGGGQDASTRSDFVLLK